MLSLSNEFGRNLTNQNTSENVMIIIFGFSFYSALYLYVIRYGFTKLNIIMKLEKMRNMIVRSTKNTI